MIPVVPRVFSGMQPTGNLHLGNYLGAMIHWINLQKEHECLYCVVDLHAITLWQDPKELYQATLEVTATYLACGLDPKKSIIFNQSQVPEHAELAWIFNCVSRLGWLNRMTQFKDKAGKDKEAASAGLYVYPNLMAADILAYRATHVPVGEDQKQHLELARDIAQKFNRDFSKTCEEKGYQGGFFPSPDPLILGPTTRVMSLKDGLKKMSKSDPSELSRIQLSDPPDTIARKIRKAKTDALPLPYTEKELAERPEAANLLSIFSGLTQKSVIEVLSDYGGKEFSFFKQELTEVCVTALSPITKELKKLLEDQAFLETTLQNGAVRARAIAFPIFQDVKDIVGLVRAKS